MMSVLPCGSGWICIAYTQPSGDERRAGSEMTGGMFFQTGCLRPLVLLLCKHRAIRKDNPAS
jgi:hypothetical protein